MTQFNKLYIDGIVLVNDHFSGIGQYVLGILRAIDNLLETDYQGLEVIVIIPFDKVSYFKRFNLKNIRVSSFPLPFRIMMRLWRRRLLPPIDSFYRNGFFIFPHFVNMKLLNSKSLLFIYDLSYLIHPEYSDEKNAAWLKKEVARSVNEVSGIITISENSKKEIETYYNLPPESISVATPAVDMHVFFHRSRADIKAAREKYNLPKKYILSLSNLEPRKNIETLIDAYCKLEKRLLEDYSLLLVGVKGWKTSSLFNKIWSRVDEGYKIITPSSYVEDEDRPAVISGATALIYPSHYEGFGMPPLEALACGIPTVTGNNSSLPEVIGGIGIKVNENDPVEISKAIENIINNKNKLSNRFKTEGPLQAEKFDWAKSAKIILEECNRLSTEDSKK